MNTIFVYNFTVTIFCGRIFGRNKGIINIMITIITEMTLGVLFFNRI